jgi:hypothetical protein
VKLLRYMLVAGTAVAATLTAWGDSVHAKPPHKAAIVRFYGDLLPKQFHSCNTCHLSDEEIGQLKESELGTGEKKPWNAFGRSLQELGKKHAASERGRGQPGAILERIGQVASLDADGDGVPNELELFAGTSPAIAKERPSGEQLSAAKSRLDEFHSGEGALVWNPFQPVERPETPAAGGDWVRNPIDAFILVEHERLGLKPRPPAEKEALLRRVYLDLVGLPPTRDELREFLNDSSPDAYDRVVDRLLASPLYGERWGRHWMDVWRYSDWAGWGQQVRDSQPHIWQWRDWIIESLNADKGYDQMVLEMLAGDELTPGDRDALRGTGFLVRQYKRLSREQWLTDTVDHTSRAFLGVTLKCAQCHDHMYDLLTQEEHYRFRAIFEPYQVRTDPLPGQLDPEKGGLPRAYDAELGAATYLYVNGDERKPDKSKPMLPGTPAFLGGGESTAEPISLPVESFYPALAPFVIDEMLAKSRSSVAGTQEAAAKADKGEQSADGVVAEVAIAKANLAAAEAELRSLEARVAVERAKYLETGKPDDEIKALTQAASKAELQAAVAKVEAAVLAAEQEVAKSRQAAEKDEKAKKGLAEAEKKLDALRKELDKSLAASKTETDKYSPLGPIYPRTSTGRRLALARWIANPQNPLTARVAANHIWARHFGVGLVPSMDEFGQNRKAPSHPALLDWLAAELMAPSGNLAADDCGCGGWSMKHLHRLIVTSNTYRTASTNDPECYGIDPDNKYLWRTTPRRVEAEVIRDSVLYVAGALDLTQGGPELDHMKGLSVLRRSVYFRSAPEKQMLFLQLFDMAPPTECYERRESVVPQQALALANSELTVREARRLARRLLGDSSDDSPGDTATYITAAFEQVLSRTPTGDELQTCLDFVTQQSSRYEGHASNLGATTAEPADLAKPSADPATRARENLVHVLLNHHEFVSIR